MSCSTVGKTPKCQKPKIMLWSMEIYDSKTDNWWLLMTLTLHLIGFLTINCVSVKVQLCTYKDQISLYYHLWDVQRASTTFKCTISDLQIVFLTSTLLSLLPGYQCIGSFVACLCLPRLKRGNRTVVGQYAWFTGSKRQHLLSNCMAHIHSESPYSFWLSRNVGAQTRWEKVQQFPDT